MSGNPTRIAETVIDAHDVEMPAFRAAWDDGLINVYADPAALLLRDASTQTEVYIRSLKSLFRRVSGSTEPTDAKEVLLDGAGNVWIRWPRTRWEPVAVVSNQATIDLALNDHFEITVDDDCEIQVPINGWPGMPFLLRLIMDGGSHAVTFASEWLGVEPVILDGDNDETILACMIVDSSVTTSAVANLVSHIPA